MSQITNYTPIGEGSYGTIFKYEDFGKDPGVVKCIRLPKKKYGSRTQPPNLYDREVAFFEKLASKDCAVVRRRKCPAEVPCEENEGAVCMDYMGNTLTHKLSEMELHDPLHKDVAQALDWIDQLNRAVQCLQRNQMYYVDMKPDNVVVHEHGLTLIDVGSIVEENDTTVYETYPYGTFFSHGPITSHGSITHEQGICLSNWATGMTALHIRMGHDSFFEYVSNHVYLYPYTMSMKTGVPAPSRLIKEKVQSMGYVDRYRKTRDYVREKATELGLRHYIDTWFPETNPYEAEWTEPK